MKTCENQKRTLTSVSLLPLLTVRVAEELNRLGELTDTLRANRCLGTETEKSFKGLLSGLTDTPSLDGDFWVVACVCIEDDDEVLLQGPSTFADVVWLATLSPAELFLQGLKQIAVLGHFSYMSRQTFVNYF